MEDNILRREILYCSHYYYRLVLSGPQKCVIKIISLAIIPLFWLFRNAYENSLCPFVCIEWAVCYYGSVEKRLLSFITAISLFGLLIPAGAFAQGAPSTKAQVPNELGRIPIMEYHQIGPKDASYTRSFDHFRQDLEWLYNNDYRAISIQDFMNQHIAVPFGKKPVVFTFDDGGYTQMNFKDGKVDPYTAIGIMDDFLKVHPDFGSAAIFYINKSPFKLVPNTKEALQYLLSTGREIGNHTLTHANLSLLDADGVMSEIQNEEDYIRSFGLVNFPLDSIAYPFGGVPKGAAMTAVAKKFRLGLLVGADPAWVPWSAKYDAMRVPRIQAIDDEWKRWFTRTPGDTARREGAEIFKPYVSDGNPDTVTAESLSGLDKAKLRSGLVAQLWDGVMPTVSASVPPVQQQQQAQSVDPVVAPTVQPVVVTPPPRPTYPYDECKDAEADTYINYKKKGVLISPDVQGWDWKYVALSPDIAKHWLAILQKKANIKRGIYFTGSTAASDTGAKLATRLLAAGGNMVTFDLDESEGSLTYGKPDQKPILKDMRAFIKDMHSRGIYVVARLVAFKEKRVLFARPDLAIQSAGGGAWKDNKGAAWLDASNPQTVQYVIDETKEAAAMGVDEVQFDYVRFPTEGNLSAMRFKGFDPAKTQKWEVIRDFMREARKQTIPTGVKLGADIFGIVGWQHGYDAKTTGQKIECIAPYLDVIYPMGYPSHFGPGFGGHKNPADEPYFFTWQTAKYFVDYAKGAETAIRPWLQSFTYRVTIPYNSDYIYQQMKGARDAGSDGFVLWNASNTYDIAWPAIGKN